MSELTGRHHVGGARVAERPGVFRAKDAATGEELSPGYAEATEGEVAAALEAAEGAVAAVQTVEPERLASLLEAIADGIDGLGDPLLERAHAETALPMPRLQGERGRCVNGARMFASMVRDGSWVQARIDRGDPLRKPPKPDVRSLLTPVGPVVVFGASNFPFAISVAGTDTVSALAARCPVVVKAHPAHPGTCEMLASVIDAAVDKAGLPGGTFSLVQGASYEVGLALTKHPLAKAVAFTGSLGGGRAIFDAAASRPEPIPVYAEMGSINPVFVLPKAAARRGAEIAKGYVQSVNMGVGQFCTCPSLLMGERGAELDGFVAAVREAAAEIAPAAMLHEGILETFKAGVSKLASVEGFEAVVPAEQPEGRAVTPAIFFASDASAVDPDGPAWEENFGPSSVIVGCAGKAEMERVAAGLEGHLTATVHAEEDEIGDYGELIRLLERRVGRIVFNGFPTGIEVCSAMHHGGPYPATTHAGVTSIGQASIYRFAKPVAYQGFPDGALPAELRDVNPRGIWRLVDGEVSREAVERR